MSKSTHDAGGKVLGQIRHQLPCTSARLNYAKQEIHDMLPKPKIFGIFWGIPQGSLHPDIAPFAT
ncbi:MAG: hypothetical protein RBS57_18990, partial [Desulforhabdus sp.]|nr:hypothetical protein [Desulforhabdus sp.]